MFELGGSLVPKPTACEIEHGPRGVETIDSLSRPEFANPLASGSPFSDSASAEPSEDDVASTWDAVTASRSKGWRNWTVISPSFQEQFDTTGSSRRRLMS